VIGQTLAHYTVLAKIGSGGMGEVYLASDRKLDRRVALKVLPPELSGGERRVRFTREAKALAALNHPNIVTVFSVEEDRGIPFITMELVEGSTLADRLPRDGWPLDRFFDLAIPIADAVAAAHQHGIVHRDLKPGNVMVTADGRVKVLDFGLARQDAGPAEASAAAKTIANSEAGLVVGTSSYMSPEQARGQPVDARSDIFSLGVVFHEMLTGRRPFPGGTPTEVLSSIIKDTPPEASAIRAGIPRELTRLVRRCLVKDPARRIQSAADIRNELEELKREMDSGDLVAEPRPAPVDGARTRRAWWATGAAVVILGLGGVAGWILTERRQMAGVRLTNPRQLTSSAGVESFPTWSPDGGRIAYVSNQRGNNDIWVVPAAGGAAVPFTADYAGNDTQPAWSPDGNQIAFISDREGGGIFVMPALGGRPERVSLRGSSEGLVGPQWSADGTELAHMRREPEGNVIEVVSLATRQTRRVPVPGEQGNRFDLSWSRDGRFFAYVRAASRDGQEANRLWVLRVADGQAFAVTDGTTGEWSPMWSADGHTLFFLSNRGGSVDLWQQPLTAQGTPDGEAVPLTVGVGMRAAALSADGRRLAYERGRPVANVWRVSILADREAVWEDAERVTSDEASVQTPDLLTDGERLVISSDRGGSRDLWMVATDGTGVRQLTADRAPDGGPRVSPDGSRIAFSSNRQGNLDIWVLPVDGGPATRLTSSPLSDMFPSWSPDGGMIAFYGGTTRGGTNLFVVPASGGEPKQITTGDVSKYFPQWSPDGKWIFFASGGGPGLYQIFRMPAGGGTPEQVTKEPAYFYRFSPDGTRLYFAGTHRGSNDLWELTLANGHERRLTRFPPGIGELGQYLAASKTHLYFTMRNDVGDIWIMDVVTDER
jgi:eukaryotic-like serine/threonine-protein kinase